ncbi:ATP-binding protein, partial [Streptomyces sp. P9(2023)]|uniref:ATP-binding protein n=1 Tax=Streptomyces sp. P9(2023) TaxID=3064394 RepID=UPI0028F45CB8
DIAIAQAAMKQPEGVFDAGLNRDGNIQVTPQWPSETLWVEGDLVRLEQVIVNLIGNAIQAMKDASQPTLTLQAEATPHHVHIHVIDNGPGIAEQHVSRIFEPFF